MSPKQRVWICNKVLTDLFNLSLKSREFPDNGVLSEKSTLKCGVPQGSILGPLLFLVYINDLSAIMDNVSTRMYAHDTNVTFTACSIPKPQQDIVDLRYLQTCLIANRLTLNVLKRNISWSVRGKDSYCHTKTRVYIKCIWLYITCIIMGGYKVNMGVY